MGEIERSFLCGRFGYLWLGMNARRPPMQAHGLQEPEMFTVVV